MELIKQKETAAADLHPFRQRFNAVSVLLNENRQTDLSTPCAYSGGSGNGAYLRRNRLPAIHIDLEETPAKQENEISLFETQFLDISA